MDQEKILRLVECRNLLQEELVRIAYLVAQERGCIFDEFLYTDCSIDVRRDVVSFFWDEPHTAYELSFPLSYLWVTDVTAAEKVRLADGNLGMLAVAEELRESSITRAEARERHILRAAIREASVPAPPLPS